MKAECVASRPGQAQPGITYTWTPGPGLQVVSGQGTATVQVQPTPGFTGSATLQVVATRAGYAASAPAQVSVQVSGGYVSISGPGGQECYYSELTYNLTGELTQGNVEWHVYLNNAPHDEFITQNFGDRIVVQPTATGNLEVRATDYDVCSPNQQLTGYASTTIVDQMRSSTGEPLYCPQMRIGHQPTSPYPNPADNVLIVPVSDTKQTTHRTATLYNFQGREVSHAKGKGELKIATAPLPAGLYSLTVEQGKQVTRYQIQVQH